MTAPTAQAEPLALFPADPYRVVSPPAPGRTQGQKRRDRQALRIALGRPPLSIDGMRIPLHPDADSDTTREAPTEGPTCGTCRFRVLVDHHGRRYPKCLAGLTADHRDALADLTHAGRISHGADTDVRAWWPACMDYQAREET